MKGGFYNSQYLESCKQRAVDVEAQVDQQAAAAAAAAAVVAQSSHNFCSDNKDYILNIYKKYLIKSLKEKKEFKHKFVSSLEELKKKMPDIGDNNIFDLHHVNIYTIKEKQFTDKLNILIKDSKEYKDLSNKLKELDKKKKEIDKEGKIGLFLSGNKALVLFLNDNLRNISDLYDKYKVYEDPTELESIMKKYNDTDICIKEEDLKLYDEKYKNFKTELNKYLIQQDKSYIKDIKCIIPFINEPNNIFEFLKKEGNFKVYVYNKFQNIYYEIYTENHALPALPALPASAASAASAALPASADYIDYLLKDDYTLIKTDDIRTFKVVNKCLLYPNYSLLDKTEQNIQKLSFIIHKSDNILRKLIFALKINTLGAINIFLKRYIVQNETNSIINYKHFTLFDVFIISNEYDTYYSMQTMKLPTVNFSIYDDKYYRDKKNETFLTYVKNQIDKNDSINSEDYKIEIENYDIIKKMFWEKIKTNQNIIFFLYTYNYLVLLNKQNSLNNIENIEKLNKKLKYNRTQVSKLICLDLYNEIIENNSIFKNYNTNIKILLNILYYKTIYNLDKIKNLINYSNQFNYLKKKSQLYDVNEKYESYLPEHYNKSRINSGIIEYRDFYNKIFNSSVINYNPYDSTDYYMNIKKYNKDGTPTEIKNVGSCGEILIFNIINLLIYDKDNINPTFLPVNTKPELKEFYKDKKIELFNTKNITEEFIPLLHNIPFVKIGDSSVYNHKYEVGGQIIRGAEIIPTYINICRILGALFGVNIDDGNSIICNYDVLKDIFNSFSGETKRILVDNFNFPFNFQEKFKTDKEANINLNYFSLFFSDSHGYMIKNNMVQLGAYIYYPKEETLYGNIITEPDTNIFNYLHIGGNIAQKMNIIKSNSFYNELFELNKFNYIKNIIVNINDFGRVVEFIKYLGYKNIEDMINKLLETEHNIDNITDIIKLFNAIFSYNENINYDNIDITILQKLSLKDNKVALKILFTLIKISFKEPKLLLMIKQLDINTIFNNQLVDYQLGNIVKTEEKNNIFRFIKNYLILLKPIHFDTNIFCNIMKYFILEVDNKSECVIYYLSLGISKEIQTDIFNKLYFLHESCCELSVFVQISYLINNYIYTVNNISIENKNQSFNLFLSLLNSKIRTPIDDKEVIMLFLKNINGYINDIFSREKPLKEIFENNYCLLKSLIFYNKFVDDKSKIIINFTRKINLEKHIEAFSLDIGKELLASFNLTFADLQKRNKYLKYKSKYLRLKKII